MSATQGCRKGWRSQASQTLIGAANKPVSTSATTTTTAGTTIPVPATLPGWHTHAVTSRVPRRATSHAYGHTHQCYTYWVGGGCPPHKGVPLGQCPPRNNSSSSPFFLKLGRSSKEQLEPWTGTTDLPRAQELWKIGMRPSRRSDTTLVTRPGATFTGECQNNHGKGGTASHDWTPHWWMSKCGLTRGPRSSSPCWDCF